MYVYVIDQFDTPFFHFFSTLAASVFWEGREVGVSSLF